MAIQAAVPKETQAGEKRVAMTPRVAERLVKLGIKFLIERGAGAGSGIPDAEYASVGTLVDGPGVIYAQADLVLKVEAPPAHDIRLMREGAILVSFVRAQEHLAELELLRSRKITAFAMELVPRISRAQNVDALSSQATVAGYKAALIAANRLQRFFPLLTTAAGTIRPARVLVIGAGVAGLQAIATARRLGAQVEGYDVRPSSREEVESLGAKFVAAEIKAAGEGGYARELTEEERRAQQESLSQHVRMADAIISAASVPGRPAPKIILKSMVESMKPGSVIVDLAAESGGNCELTQPGHEVTHGHVTLLGPLNVPSLLAEDASAMYATNLFNFLTLLLKNGQISLDWTDEVVAGMALTHDGEIRHEATRRLIEGATECLPDLQPSTSSWSQPSPATK